MNVVFNLAAVNTFNMGHSGNVQGDEAVARSLLKHIQKMGHTGHVVGGCPPNTVPADIVIHFFPLLERWDGCKNVLFLQNVFPEPAWPGGTVGQFQLYRRKFDDYIFTSARLRDACDVDGLVLPFAADIDDFRPHPPMDELKHSVVLVGNNIRGAEVNARYIEPVADKLTIYGNPWEGPLSKCCRGKLPAELEPILYSSATICLNAHLKEHIQFETLNARLFSIMACNGFIISDDTPALDGFRDCVVTTSGYADLREKVHAFMFNKEARDERASLGRSLVLGGHTYAHRATDLMGFLQSLS